MIVVATAFIAGLIALLVGLMILWNNLVHRVTPSFALALDPGRDDAVREKRRPRNEPVLGGRAVRC
ncbi:cation transporting ATPase C-terminal domain-containing protein [Glaciibacter superstes]|uniref:cation transporting ATPase C-terminal domain-containing protein n=1 Tax=Glaciibacter superstes TaxID=501023 RepID=UPI0003B4EE8B|nr:cation transporting ATPase C-terminal domain-containing protein [Glaciibacter superstes]